MLQPGPEPPFGPRPEESSWFAAIAIVVTIAICLVAFVWIFMRLNPYLSDFVTVDAPTVVPAASPSASPPAQP